MLSRPIVRSLRAYPFKSAPPLKSAHLSRLQSGLDSSRTMSSALPGSKASNTTQKPSTIPNSSLPITNHKKLRYIDIAINLSDPVYRGVHHGRTVHEDDLQAVIQRALSIGCSQLMITGSSLHSASGAITLSQQNPSICYSTVGVHPCSTKDFLSHPGGAQALLKSLRDLISEHAYPKGPVTAIGEIGLDYDRLSLAPKDTQLQYFEAQLDLATSFDHPLPLFLHSRAAAEDFEALLRPMLHLLPRRGLVHSFTGTVNEMRRLVEMGFDIGINGCSIRAEEGCEVVKEIPLERIQVETDGPWCEIRPSHYSKKFLAEGESEEEKAWRAVKKERFVMGKMIKGRNEPCMVRKVVEVIAGVKGLPMEQVAEAAFNNSVRMFGLGVNPEGRGA